MCLAVPGKITEIDNAEPLMRMAKVDFGGVVKAISLACLPDAQLGTYVLVHAGIAISAIDEAEAQRIYDSIDVISELES